MKFKVGDKARICGGWFTGEGFPVEILKVMPHPNRVVGFHVEIPDIHHGCEHHWIPYIGLHECYEYCKHCDEKRSITK